MPRVRLQKLPRFGARFTGNDEQARGFRPCTRTAGLTRFEKANDMVRVSARVWLPVVTLLALTACGGVTSVDDNQSEVCGQLVAVEGGVTQALALGVPESSIASGLAGVDVAQAKALVVARAMTTPQQQLLDRFERALTDYETAMLALPEGAIFADYNTGLDSHKANIMITYRTMLTTVGCPVPAFLQNYAKSE